MVRACMMRGHNMYVTCKSARNHPRNNTCLFALIFTKIRHTWRACNHSYPAIGASTATSAVPLDGHPSVSCLSSPAGCLLVHDPISQKLLPRTPSLTQSAAGYRIAERPANVNVTYIAHVNARPELWFDSPRLHRPTTSVTETVKF